MAKASSEPTTPRPARRRVRAEDGKADRPNVEPGEAGNGESDDHLDAAHSAPAPDGEKASASEHDGDSRAVARAGGADAHGGQSRFRIFVIDTGWTSPASRALHANMPVLMGMTRWDPIYVLDRETSIAVMRDHRDLVGKDPIISVHDLWAMKHHGHTREHGFRMHLGLLTDEDKALAALKMFAHFMARFRLSRDLEKHVHRQLRMSGLSGAIEIVGGAAAHHAELME